MILPPVYPAHKLNDGTMRMRLTNRNVSGLSSNRNLEEEIWTQLDYLHTVVDIREKFLKSKGFKKQSEINSIGREFGAYLVQAKNFYQHAKSSDYRSAALLYYYSFLNIAKAVVIIQKPHLSHCKFVHGLQRVKKSGDLSELTIKSKGKQNNHINTFDEFYEVIFGESFNSNEEVSLLDLFSYCSDITQEYQDVAGKANRISYVSYVIAMDSGRKKTWNKIAVRDWGKQKNYSTAYANFLSNYTAVSVPSSSRQSEFDIKGPAYDVTFFEANKEFDFIGGDGLDWYSCRSELDNTLKGLYQVSMYNAEDINFELVAPIDDESGIRLDEVSSIYMAMYYLSEIVRYNPELFDSQMNIRTSDGWLLKGFIEQAPVTFLYRVLSVIKDVDVFYQARR